MPRLGVRRIPSMIGAVVVGMMIVRRRMIGIMPTVRRGMSRVMSIVRRRMNGMSIVRRRRMSAAAHCGLCRR